MKTMNVFIFVFIFSFISSGRAFNKKNITTEGTESKPISEGFDNKMVIDEYEGDITLKKALSLALLKNPELSVFSWEIRAAEAKRLQAGLLTNPDLDIEMENIGGKGELKGIKNMEMSIQLSQLIELGGKRFKRKHVAELEKNLAEWDYESKKLDIYLDVTFAYINVLTAQKKLALREEITDLTKQLHSMVSDKVKAGKVSPVDKTKAEIDLSISRIELKQAEKELYIAKKMLASLWGSTTPLFNAVKGTFNNLTVIPKKEDLNEFINKNPDLTRWTTELKRYKAELEYSKAGAIPDLTLSGGYKKSNETGDASFIIGASVPLQFYNRNKEEIMQAGYSFRIATQKRRAEEIRIRTSLDNAYNNLSTAFSDSIEWKENLIPGAQKTFEAVQEGYAIGKFGILDVLDAERILFEIRSRYIDTIAEYHKEVAIIERLTGTTFNEMIED